jgi:beta-N-acetylhexosaminidase
VRKATAASLFIALTLIGCTPTPPGPSPTDAPLPTARTPPPATRAPHTTRAVLATALPLAADSPPDVETRPTPSATPSPTVVPTPSPLPAPPTPDPVEPLMTRMTIEQKVGQLFMIYPRRPTFDAEVERIIIEDHLGGLILFAPNVENPAQVAELVNRAQSIATTSGAGIPLLIAADQEGGRISRLWDGFTQFPGNMAIGATHDPESARRIAQAIAREMRAVGINMNLAPVLDVNSNPLNPIIGTRSFGDSPELVVQMGLPMIETYREQGVVATAKHFPGHGDTEEDSHRKLPAVSHPLDHLWAVELVPFQAAIDAGVDVIMTAHVSFPAIDPTPDLPATLSPLVLQDLLRGQMGFDGVIATDSLGMRALSEIHDSSEAAALALQAGADLLMFGKDPGYTLATAHAAYVHVLAMVQAGEIPIEQIDASVRRVLTLKARYGLLTWQPVDPAQAARSCGTAQHRAAAFRVATDSVTLLENDGLLPLSPGQSLLLVVPDKVDDLDDALRPHFPTLNVVVVSLDPTVRQIAAASRHAAAADAVVVATWDAAQHPSQVSLVRALSAYPEAVVALNTPYDLAAFQEAGVIPSAYLCTYGDAPPSLEALAMVLIGNRLPRGRLPVAVGDAYPVGSGWQQFETPQETGREANTCTPRLAPVYYISGEGNEYEQKGRPGTPHPRQLRHYLPV